METQIGNTRLNYIDWHHIYQKADGANANRERCHCFYDQRITKLLRCLTTTSDYLDARATKFQILKISYQLG